MSLLETATISGGATGIENWTGGPTIAGAPYVIDSQQRESLQFWLFLSGGGSWAFYHYGILRSLIQEMIKGTNPVLAKSDFKIAVGTSGGSPWVKAMAHALNSNKPRAERLRDALIYMDRFQGSFVNTPMDLMFGSKGGDFWTVMQNNVESGADLALDMQALQIDQVLPRKGENWITRLKRLTPQSQLNSLRMVRNQWGLNQALKWMQLVDPDHHNHMRAATNASLQRHGASSLEEHFFTDASVADGHDAVIASCSVMGHFKGVAHPDGILWDGGHMNNPPMVSALEALGIGQPAPSDRVHAIVSSVSCSTLPCDGTSVLAHPEYPFVPGNHIAEQIALLRALCGDNNIHTTCMFNAVRRPVAESTKKDPNPRMISTFIAYGAQDAKALMASITGHAPADRPALV